MRLATVRDGSRDGSLVLVDAAGQYLVRAADIAPNLQWALDEWARCEPRLRERAARLELGHVSHRERLDPRVLTAPLPRAYEWIDGSAYLNHIRLVRKARGAELPPSLERDPLVYQGGSGVLLGPTDPLVCPPGDAGLDFEGEIAVVVGDVPRGVTVEEAASAVRLVMLANDVTYRELVPAELKKGFGFFVSKPATAFSPFAVTPDELGDSFRGARVFLRLVCTYNGAEVGNVDTGPEMHFSFAELLAHVAQTRSLTAGTILGSGTVSNADPSKGVSCLVERRTREVLESGAARTPYMRTGDRIRIEAFDAAGRSVFGPIEQHVVAG
jgi:fumarylacetoacetate (FAA) hydrolase